MRSLAIVTFAVITMGAFCTPALAASTIHLTPCAPVTKAREAARMVEASLYDRVRRYDSTISPTEFQQAIDEMTWDFINGNFVSEILGSTTMGSMRVAVVCQTNPETGVLELRPLIAFEPGKSYQ